MVSLVTILYYIKYKKKLKKQMETKYTIKKSIEVTTNYLIKNKWILQRKK